MRIVDNKERFNERTKTLEAVSLCGSSAYLDGDEYQRGLDVCLELLKKCDILVICPGWENSKGCKQEVKLAIDNNIPVFLLGNWKQEVLMDNELEPYYDFMERRKIEEMECYSE